MSARPVLLLDMEGPLADFDTYGWQRCADAGHEFDAGFHDRRHRFFTDHMPHVRHRKDARRMIESPGWFFDLPVTEGATEGVPELMEHFDVWVCTKPLEANPTCRDEKGAWLRRHFPALEDRLIIAPDKSLIRGSILLDDAIKPAWTNRAEWLPVVFTEPFNGAGSEWADWPHWTWADGMDALLALAP